MRTENYQRQLDELYSELEMVINMSELEACEYGNCDSKQEHLEAIQEEIDYCEEKIRELGSEDEGYSVDLFSVSLNRCALFV